MALIHYMIYNILWLPLGVYSLQGSVLLEAIIKMILRSVLKLKWNAVSSSFHHLDKTDISESEIDG